MNLAQNFDMTKPNCHLIPLSVNLVSQIQDKLVRLILHVIFQLAAGYTRTWPHILCCST